jgi:hypothetical protein
MNRFRAWVGSLHVGQVALLVPSLLVTGALALLAGWLNVPSVDEARGRLATAQERLRSDSVNRLMKADQRMKAERWDVLVAQGLSGEAAQAQVEYEFASAPRGCEASDGHLAALRKGIPIPDPLDPSTGRATFRCASWLAENFEVVLKWERASKEHSSAVEVAKQDVAREDFERGLLLWGGGIVSASLWCTAFLSLWWWFGARAEPRETL